MLKQIMIGNFKFTSLNNKLDHRECLRVTCYYRPKTGEKGVLR